MTDTAINTQIRTIERATKSAVKNRKSALQFLEEAGILKPVPQKKQKARK